MAVCVPRIRMNFLFSPILRLIVIICLYSIPWRSICRATAASQRHAYIGAIPFTNMKLDAPVLTSLKNTSRRQCGVRCLQEPLCSAFNYHVTSRTCQLLSDYVCSQLHDLVAVQDFRYYDCEKDTDIQNITEARASKYCHSEAACSPKCACNSVGFSTFPNSYLSPDSPGASPLVLKDSKLSCILACLEMPLPLCRSINTNATTAGTQCQFLPFLKSERPSARFTASPTWAYSKRKCFA